MHDPEQRVVNAMMADALPPDISLDVVSELVRQSEIDFRTLKQHIRSLLEEDSQVSIGQLVAAYPVEQGLGASLAMWPSARSMAKQQLTPK